jgi:hypothetical protein
MPRSSVSRRHRRDEENEVPTGMVVAVENIVSTVRVADM